MKGAVGYFVLACVILFSLHECRQSAVASLNKGKSVWLVILLPLEFIICFIYAYIVIAFVGGILWGLAWVVILILEILQWPVEAIFYPFQSLATYLFN